MIRFGESTEMRIFTIRREHCAIRSVVNSSGDAIEVAPLSRVERFKSAYRRKDSGNFFVPLDEVYRLSHFIPSQTYMRSKPIELNGTFIPDPLMVPNKDGECFSMILFFWKDPKLGLSGYTSYILLISKRKGISSVNKDTSSHMSGSGNINGMKNQEAIVVVNANNGGQEVETAEHEIIHRRLNMQFHDFEDTRVEKSFELGQIWALHSVIDGLPYSYARIDKSIFSEGKVEVSLLKHHPITEGEMCRDEENLAMGCWAFRASTSTCIKEITLFSHRVIYNEGKSLKFFEVFPRKGEVWAIYKDWDINWSSHDVKNNVQYKLVEVITDFTEEASVTVVALIKEEGHENVFRRQLHEGLWLFMATFKRKQLLRFSHCIPSLKMRGDANGNANEL